MLCSLHRLVSDVMGVGDVDVVSSSAKSRPQQQRLNRVFWPRRRGGLVAPPNGGIVTAALCHSGRWPVTGLVVCLWIDVRCATCRRPPCTTINGMRHPSLTWMPDSLAADAAARATVWLARVASSGRWALGERRAIEHLPDRD
jgi:hypothetical protein